MHHHTAVVLVQTIPGDGTSSNCECRRPPINQLLSCKMISFANIQICLGVSRAAVAAVVSEYSSTRAAVYTDWGTNLGAEYSQCDTIVTSISNRNVKIDH